MTDLRSNNRSSLYRRSTSVLCLVTALAMVFSCLSGCAEEGSGGTDIGNPETSVTTHFLGYDGSATPGGLTLDSGIEIETAWIVVEQIELEASSSCGTDEVVDDAGPIVINLLEGAESPRTPTFVRPSGDYCRMGFKLAVLDNADLLPADAPPELADHSVVLKGTTSGILLDLPFVMELNFDDEILLTPSGDNIRVEGEQQSFIVGFALELVVTVDLLDSVGGVVDIVIDPSSDPALLEDLRLAISNSAQLFLDADLDGELDPTEAMSPVAQ